MMYDSLAGPSLSLRPEELDRLDASELDGPPGGSLHDQVHDHDPPSIDIDTSHYRNLEASIDRYVKSYDVRRNGDDGNGASQGNAHNNGRYISGPRDADNVFMYNGSKPAAVGRNPTYYESKNSDFATGPFTGRDSLSYEPMNAASLAAPPINHQNNVILTPPSSSGQPNIQHGEKGSLKDMLKVEKEKTMSEMQQLCDRRIESIQRSETERIQRLEADYRQQLSKLQQDLDSMLHQHQQVIKLKNEVERGLQLELDITRRDLKREKEARQTEKERLQKNIRELNEKIRDLERKVTTLNRAKQKKKRSVTFRDYDDYEYEDESQNERLSRATVEEYEERISNMRMEHDAKIANLVRHFEKEKAAALEILRSKVKAEISLLVPRIKEQYLRAYSNKLKGIKEDVASRLRTEFEAKMRRLREEQAMERRLWQRQTREIVERERQEALQKLKAKYELKLMDVRNECERRILQRLRANRRGLAYDQREDHFDDNNNDYDGSEGEDVDDSLTGTEYSLADLSFV